MKRLFSTFFFAITLTLGASTIIDHCTSYAQGFVEGMNTFNVNNFGAGLSCDVYQAVYANALSSCRVNEQ
jgi:hypothetical protein